MHGDEYQEILDKFKALERKISQLFEEIETKEKEIKQLKKERNIQEEIQPGTILHGFCNGFFGRDSYGDKVIEAIGPDWVVAREDCVNQVGEPVKGEPLFADFSDWQGMYLYLTDWAKPEWKQEQ